MKRYFSSFFISILIYSILLVPFLFSFDNIKNISNKKNENKKSSSVSFSIITPPLEKIIEHEKKLEVKPEEVKPKEIPKKIIKKEPKKIVKKIEKKPKKIVEKPKEEPKKIIEKPKEEPKKIVESKPIVQKVIAKSKNSDNSTDIQAIKNEFLTKLKEKIYKNKEYPKIAKRRGIEGDCKISFVILENGCLGEVKIHDAKRVFKESILQTINDSFPINIPNELKEFPMEVKLTLSYHLQ